MNKTDKRNSVIKYRANKECSGNYNYRGFKISRVRGYWEAEDKDGTGFAHSSTLRETKMIIDYHMDEQKTRIYYDR